MRFAFFVLCLTASAAAQPRSFEALDAIVRNGRVIAVDPGGRSLTATAIETGARVWRAPLGEPAQAAVIHDLGGGRVLVQVAQRYFAIELATGNIVQQRPAPPDWTFVHRSNGACGLMRECELAPVSCDDGHALGAPLHGSHIERWFDGEASSSCDGVLYVLARAGDLSLYIAGSLHGSVEVVAVDSQGAVRWRSSSLTASPTPMGSGVSPDARTCWVTSHEANGVVLRAFGCTNGRRLFERHYAISGYRNPPILTGWTDRGLFVAEPSSASVLATNGRVIWRREEIAPNVLVLPPGLRVGDYPLALDAFTTIEHVRADGSTERTESVGERDVRSIGGAIVLAPTGATGDRGGAPVAAPRTFGFVRSNTGSHADVGTTRVLNLPGDAWVLGEHSNGGHTWLVVDESRPGHPDRIHVVRAP